MRTPMAAALIVLLSAGSAFAAQGCAEQLSDLAKTWGAISFPTPERPSQQIVVGKGGHVHTGPEVLYMKKQITFAAHLCKSGNEHEAMLRMDVVRAWLKLPEVEHPPEHAYTPPAKK